jgi:plastocyanin
MTRALAVVAVLLLSPLVPWRSGHAAEARGRVVTSDGTGVAGAVVFLRAPVGPSPAAAPPRSAVMDQIDKQFVPHVLPIAVGTEVRFPNHDQIHHHVYSFSRVKSFDLPLSKGEEAPPVLFDAPGVVKVGCNIHDWMNGVILVVPSAAFTVTDDGGAFVLRDLPAGDVTLAAWHEASESGVDESSRRITVGDGAPEVVFTLAIKPSDRARPSNYGARNP